jgi:hypothetical protein
MSETPPGGLPKSVGPQPASPAPGDGTGGLRVVAILVMIGSVLGLLGSGFCFLAFLSEGGFYGEMFGILILVAPALLFFAGSIWVCKALLDRLKK